MFSRKSLKMKLVSFVAIATVAFSAFNFAGSPTVVHASIVTSPALSAVNPVAVSNGNKTVTLTFDQPIELATTNAPSVPVLIKRSGEGSFVQSDLDTETGVRVIDAKKLQFTFDSPLTGTANQIQVQAGAVVNADDQVNDTITTDAIALNPVTPPTLVDATAVNTSDNDVAVTTVTLNFNRTIVDHTNGLLKNAIRLDRYNDDYGFNYMLGASDTAAIDETGTKLVITFHDLLVGDQNRVFVYGAALVDQYGNVIPDTVTRLLTPTGDVIAPQLQRTDIGNRNHDITFTFDEAILNATADAASLKNAVNVVSGSDFEPDATHPFAALGDDDTVTISGNKLVVHFATALTEADNYIQIAADTLKDANGNTITDDTTEYFQPKDLLAPTIVDQWFDTYQILSKPVTVAGVRFNKVLTDLTLDANGVSHLRDNITYSVDGGNTFLPLGPDDSVMQYDSQINILFHTTLGGNLFFKLAAGSVADDNGNILNESLTIDAGQAPVSTFATNLYSDVPSELTFSSNPDWESKIQKIEVTQQVNFRMNWYWDAHEPVIKTLTPADYTITSGKITIKQGLFENDSAYRIRVVADGYSDQTFQNRAHISNQSYYVTPTVFTRTNGITAQVAVAQYHGTNGSATVIFQLKNGNIPVSIVAVSASYLNEGLYTANFNVPDPSNPNYKVHAYVVSEYSNDPASVGINLATELSQTDFDWWYWNEN